MDFSLSAQKRDITTKLSTIRNRTDDSPAQIPAVVYGHKIKPATLTLDYSEFLKLFRRAGRSHVITLTIDGKEKHDVLVQDLQLDPVSGNFIHVDFHAIVANEKIHTKVPVILVGESPAVKKGLMIEQNINEIEISCLPRDLVGEIEMSVEKIEKEGDVLHVSDIVIDRNKIHITLPDDAPIASAHAPRAHKVEDDAPVETEEGDDVADQEEKTEE